MNNNYGDPRAKEQIKPKMVLEYRSGETRPLSSFPPPGCKGPPEQYNLSPLLRHREKVFALLFPHPGYVFHPISK